MSYFSTGNGKPKPFPVQILENLKPFPVQVLENPSTGVLSICVLPELCWGRCNFSLYCIPPELNRIILRPLHVIFVTVCILGYRYASWGINMVYFKSVQEIGLHVHFSSMLLSPMGVHGLLVLHNQCESTLYICHQAIQVHAHDTRPSAVLY